MKITHINAGPDGETHLTDIDLVLETTGEGVAGVEFGAIMAGSVRFRQFDPGRDLGWHPAPRRQFVLVMAGAVEVTATDGTARRFTPGDVFLADDLNSKGHRTRALDEGCSFASVPCPQG